jgi:ABC-2 type transport system ATP-binding protein
MASTQEKVAVGALLHDPEIIFLDEPTAGVTSAVRAKFWGLIKELAKQNKTVFVTSHYMDEVEQCGRIGLMEAGELIALGTPSALKKQSFPGPLYELMVQEAISFAKVKELKQSGHFYSFEPHGLHYHVLPKNPGAWRAVLSHKGIKFIEREIPPTLEDVFIRLVEGKTS